jgi:hypothetical protein
MKRVKQVSLDILVGPETDGDGLALEIQVELERRGFKILGAAFQDDLTDVYTESYSELLEEE